MPSLTPTTLEALGKALYGPGWQSALARDLDITPRAVRHWMAGAHKVPKDVCARLRDAFAAKIEIINRADAKRTL